MALKTFILLAAALVLLRSSPLVVAQNILYGGSSLFSGQSLNYVRFTVTMQGDCNLVLYDAGNAVWATGTYGRGINCRATMQEDGNLVVYTGSDNVLWASNTNRGRGNYVLILQSDRNLVIYDGNNNPLWASNTVRRNANGDKIDISGDIAGRKDVNVGGEKGALVTNRG